MKSHSNTASEKENGSSPETKLKITEDCALTENSKQLSGRNSPCCRKTEKQFNESRKKIMKRRNILSKRLKETLKKEPNRSYEAEELNK